MQTRDRTVLVERMIDTPPIMIFELLATPARHHEIDGSSMVLGRPRGPERLHLGAEFSMRMKQGGLDYRTSNEVVEFEEGSLIAWRTHGVVRGRKVVGGQLWRFRLTEQQTGTLVAHEYVWGAASVAWALSLLGYPRRMQPAMVRTLQRLEQAVTSMS